jgi:hypothetical protein
MKTIITITIKIITMIKRRITVEIIKE